jgi:hypothetical protein
MYRRGPNPLADMDRGVHIRRESKFAVTPVRQRKAPNRPRDDACPVIDSLSEIHEPVGEQDA